MNGNKVMTVPRSVDADELGPGAHARAHSGTCRWRLLGAEHSVGRDQPPADVAAAASPTCLTAYTAACTAARCESSVEISD
jgi:hypothetical protein